MVAAAKQAGVQVTCEASPHHLVLTEHAVRGLDTRMKMNPPLRTEADRQALIEGLRVGRRSTASPPTTPRTRATRRRSPSSRRRWARPAWRPRSPRSTPSSSCPGVLDLATVVERMTAGGEPFGIPAPGVRVGEEANLVLVDLAAEWEVGEDGYESRSEHCCFAGRRLRGRVLLTLAAGGVAYRERAFAVTAA